MTSTSKRKGDSAELEVQGIFRDHLGVGRRALGAGRRDDVGDITGVDGLTVQVVNWRDVTAAVREKPRECVEQQERAGSPFGATFIRLRGGEWRVVLTVDQFMALYREAA